MAIEQCYRSNHADVMAAVAQCDAENAAFHDRIEAMKADLDMTEWRTLVRRGHSATGFAGFLFEYQRDEQGRLVRGDRGRLIPVRAVPDGWRTVRPAKGDDFIWTHRGTKAGKAVAVRVDQVTPCPLLATLLPGMPRRCFVSEESRDYGPGYLLTGDYLYVTWGTTHVDDQVDHDIWQTVKRSEFYAAEEAQEAKEVRT